MGGVVQGGRSETAAFMKVKDCDVGWGTGKGKGKGLFVSGVWRIMKAIRCDE